MKRRNFIVFRAPEKESELDQRPDQVHNIKIKFAGFNKALAEKLAKYNGLQITYANDYDVFWGQSPDVDQVPTFSPTQVFNHFPESKNIIGDKGSFAQVIQNHYLYSKLVDFFPKTYILPADNSQLFYEMRKHQNKQYISKPPRGSGGNGITVITYKDFNKINPNSVVSEYIERPLLIDEFKFDLRIYVLVTSFVPLRAFIYKDGFARFATNCYSDKFSPFACITNSQLNRKSKFYGSGNDFKWTLQEVLLEINQRWKVTPEVMMNKLKRLVSRTLLFMQSALVNDRSENSNFFELYGFDVIIDSNFHAWLLEVNTSPCMGVNEYLDYDMKGPLLARTMSIALLPLFEKKSEKRMIELEDMMNDISGGGFERIFPSKFTEALEFHLIKPKVQHVYDLTNLKALGASLTSAQGMSLLLHILIDLENTISTQKAQNTNILKLHNFLTAQGIRILKSSAGLRVGAKSYIATVNNWISESNEDFLVPYDIREKILSLPDKSKLEILSSCAMSKIKSVNLLFE